MRLSIGRKLLLSTAGLLAVSAPLVFGLLHATQTRAQSQTEDPATKLPAFEVISVKPNKSETMMFRAQIKPDGINASNAPLIMLVRMAYELFSSNDDQITGAPGWAKSERWDIEAKVSGSDVPEVARLSRSQRNAMLQSVLIDRFKLAAHRETRDLPIYALIVAKSGMKIKEATPGYTYPNGIKGPDGHSGPGLVTFGPNRIDAQGIPLDELAGMLTQLTGRTVVNQTGLVGKYDIALKWTPEDLHAAPGGASTQENAPNAESSGPSIFTAIQEQLGLKLEATRGPVEGLVIDHVERPSEN